MPDVTFTYSETTDLMVGKSFDCRLGCAAILKTMHTLAGQDLNVDIVGACAAQEEVGVRGATVTAQVIKPDIGQLFLKAARQMIRALSSIWFRLLLSVARCFVTLIHA